MCTVFVLKVDCFFASGSHVVFERGEKRKRERVVRRKAHMDPEKVATFMHFAVPDVMHRGKRGS